MKLRRYESWWLPAAAVLLLAGAAVLAGQAPDGALPRTPWGDPDLQGIWNGKTQTPLERPERHAGREFLTDQEVADLEQRSIDDPGRDIRADQGSLLDVADAYNNIWSSRYGSEVVRTGRTSLIIDPPNGRLPPLTPEGRQRVEAERAFRQRYGRVSEVSPGGPTDNPEDRPQDRCRGATLPCIGALCAFSRIVQSPGWVSIYVESGHHGGVYRHIPVGGGPHIAGHIRQWLGDPRGSWEGDTLVVDTTNFSDLTSFQGSGAQLHLTERFTRMAPDLVIYRATIEDQTVFTRPWTLEMTLTLQDDRSNQIFEAACHEGNYAMTNVLAGARAWDGQ